MLLIALLIFISWAYFKLKIKETCFFTYYLSKSINDLDFTNHHNNNLWCYSTNFFWWLGINYLLLNLFFLLKTSNILPIAQKKNKYIYNISKKQLLLVVYSELISFIVFPLGKITTQNKNIYLFNCLYTI